MRKRKKRKKRKGKEKGNEKGKGKRKERVVYCDHASILHRDGDMKPQMLDERTDGRTDTRVIFILCPMLLHCIGQTKYLRAGGNAGVRAGGHRVTNNPGTSERPTHRKQPLSPSGNTTTTTFGT